MLCFGNQPGLTCLTAPLIRHACAAAGGGDAGGGASTSDDRRWCGAPVVVVGPGSLLELGFKQEVLTEGKNDDSGGETAAGAEAAKAPPISSPDSSQPGTPAPRQGWDDGCRRWQAGVWMHAEASRDDSDSGSDSGSGGGGGSGATTPQGCN